MKITVIDYKGGNIASAVNALKTLTAEDADCEIIVTSKPEDIENTEMIVFPGQGAARQAIESLKNLNILEPLKMRIIEGVPYLGICIGMQVLFDYSEEQDTKCMGIIEGKVVKFADKSLKIPQMGWNNVSFKRKVCLNEGIEDDEYFYFANSYYPKPEDKKIILGETIYGKKFGSIIVKDSIVATQFHPEKSGKIGLQFLDNFLNKYK